jgi:hypothetical protein
MDDNEAEARIHGALRELLGVTGAKSHDSFSSPDNDQKAHHCDKLANKEQQE